MHVVMGWVRRASGREFGHVQFDRKPGVRRAFENGTGAGWPVLTDRKILEAVRLRRQGVILRRGGGCGQSG